MEDDSAVLKWLRPPMAQIPIDYARRPCKPDFVAETATRKYLLETKERKAVSEGDVLAKAKPPSNGARRLPRPTSKKRGNKSHSR